MDKPPAVAFTAFAEMWPRATEAEISAALCAISEGRTLNFLTLTLCCFDSSYRILDIFFLAIFLINPREKSMAYSKTDLHFFSSLVVYIIWFLCLLWRV